MAANTVYLVTGANRGIGAGIVTHLLSRPNTTVIATARKLSSFSPSNVLSEDQIAPGSKVIPFLLDDSIPAISSATLVARLEAEHGITSLNVVIANAGGSSGFYDVLGTQVEGLKFDFEVNTLGPVRLFRATWPLLEAPGRGQGVEGQGKDMKKVRKFAVVSSALGSMAITAQEMAPGVAYGMSKAAVNYFCVRVAGEFKEKGLLVGVLHPGWVKTDMGQSFADAANHTGEIPTDVSSSAKGIIERIDALIPETSGRFFSYDGKELPW